MYANILYMDGMGKPNQTKTKTKPKPIKPTKVGFSEGKTNVGFMVPL